MTTISANIALSDITIQVCVIPGLFRYTLLDASRAELFRIESNSTDIIFQNVIPGNYFVECVRLDSSGNILSGSTPVISDLVKGSTAKIPSSIRAKVS